MLPGQQADDDVLKLLANALPGLVSYVGRDRRYRFLNARYRDWFCIEPADFIGKCPSAFIDAETYDRTAPYMERALAGETVSFCSEITLANGDHRHVRSQFLPHLSSGGDVLGMFTLTIDITEEKKAEAVLEQARDGAIETARDKSRFLAAASHDLRQPLHALTLFTRALGRRVETAETKELVAHMETALHSLHDMFNALLNVSRLDAGLIEPELENVRVQELLNDLEAGFAVMAEEQGLTFRVRTLDLIARSDHALLETMLRNLIANALKFTESGGILVGCRRRGQRLRIEVYDTGPGIQEDQFETIFHEFQRTANRAGGVNEGLGLGLAIVRRFATLLDMSVDVRSVVGKGSRFAIELPFEMTSAGTTTITADLDADVSRLAGLRVLVLDDDPVVVDAVAQELTDHGASVVTASNRSDLIEMRRSFGGLDAAVVDYDMPEGSGPSLLAELGHGLGADVPAVIITGSTDPETLGKLSRCSYRWLIKPVDPDVLVNTVFGLGVRAS